MDLSRVRHPLERLPVYLRAVCTEYRTLTNLKLVIGCHPTEIRYFILVRLD